MHISFCPERGMWDGKMNDVNAADVKDESPVMVHKTVELIRLRR